MAKDLPAGFDRTKILAGLHTAMEFGEPSRTSDKATFYLVTSSTDVDVERDEDEIPFDPGAIRTTKPVAKVVPCAIEYVDRADQAESFGVFQTSRIKITLLDPDYQQVKGFKYVIVAGDKYMYRLTEPPVALGSIDVWTVHAIAEDES